MQFLTDATQAQTLAAFHAQAGQPARGIAATRQHSARCFVVVFHDRLFDATGFAVHCPDRHSLVPHDLSRQSDPLPSAAADPAAFDATLLARAGFIADAPAGESDLFMAITAAGGHHAEAHPDVYPDGACAAAARAYLDAPGMEPDATRHPKISDLTVTFHNLPSGTAASLRVENVAQDHETVFSAWSDVAAGPVTVATNGTLRPGVQDLRAEVRPPDGAPILLRRDFSVEVAYATLALDKTRFAPGERIDVRFAGMSGSAQDCISTAAAGAPNSSHLAHVYTDGAREGTLRIAAPTTPGADDLRAFFAEDKRILRGNLAFDVK